MVRVAKNSLEEGNCNHFSGWTPAPFSSSWLGGPDSDTWFDCRGWCHDMKDRSHYKSCRCRCEGTAAHSSQHWNINKCGIKKRMNDKLFSIREGMKNQLNILFKTFTSHREHQAIAAFSVGNFPFCWREYDFWARSWLDLVHIHYLYHTHHSEYPSENTPCD